MLTLICPKPMMMAAAEVKPLMTGQEMKSSRSPGQPRGNTTLVPALLAQLAGRGEGSTGAGDQWRACPVWAGLESRRDYGLSPWALLQASWLSVIGKG